MNVAAIKVLVIDDEPPIRKLLRMGLSTQGYDVLEASNGKIALELLTQHPALIILDLGLPDIQGHDLLRMIRARDDAVPIVVLSSRGDEAGKVQALDLGADDYLTKPFGVVELAARLRVAVRHLLRRDVAEPLVVSGDLQVDLEARKVHLKGEEVHLTPLEFRLLAALARRRGKVVTHQQLLTEVWGSAQAEQTQYLHLYMRQLRHKIEDDPKRPRYFRTDSGVGYRMEMLDPHGEIT